MVSFSCEACNDTIKKPKLDNHKIRCPHAIFTCLDCNKTFHGTSYKSHTSCITEAEKVEGSLFKGKKTKDLGALSHVNGTSNGLGASNDVKDHKMESEQSAPADEEVVPSPSKPKKDKKEKKDKKKKSNSGNAEASSDAPVAPSEVKSGDKSKKRKLDEANAAIEPNPTIDLDDASTESTKKERKSNVKDELVMVESAAAETPSKKDKKKKDKALAHTVVDQVPAVEAADETMLAGLDSQEPKKKSKKERKLDSDVVMGRTEVVAPEAKVESKPSKVDKKKSRKSDIDESLKPVGALAAASTEVKNSIEPAKTGFTLETEVRRDVRKTFRSIKFELAKYWSLSEVIDRIDQKIGDKHSKEEITCAFLEVVSLLDTSSGLKATVCEL